MSTTLMIILFFATFNMVLDHDFFPNLLSHILFFLLPYRTLLLLCYSQLDQLNLMWSKLSEYIVGSNAL